MRVSSCAVADLPLCPAVRVQCRPLYPCFNCCFSNVVGVNQRERSAVCSRSCFWLGVLDILAPTHKMKCPRGRGERTSRAPCAEHKYIIARIRTQQKREFLQTEFSEFRVVANLQCTRALAARGHSKPCIFTPALFRDNHPRLLLHKQQ